MPKTGNRHPLRRLPASCGRKRTTHARRMPRTRRRSGSSAVGRCAPRCCLIISTFEAFLLQHIISPRRFSMCSSPSAPMQFGVAVVYMAWGLQVWFVLIYGRLMYDLLGKASEVWAEDGSCIVQTEKDTPCLRMRRMDCTGPASTSRHGSERVGLPVRLVSLSLRRRRVRSSGVLGWAYCSTTAASGARSRRRHFGQSRLCGRSSASGSRTEVRIKLC